MNALTTEQRGVLALAEQIRPALLRASRALRREAQRAGVSALDAQLLGVVKNHAGIGVSALADLEQMSRASMSGHVKRLEAAGWIERTGADVSDRRRFGLSLTAKGSRALDAIRRGRNDWLAGRLATLAAGDRAALAAAAEPLRRLADDR